MTEEEARFMRGYIDEYERFLRYGPTITTLTSGITERVMRYRKDLEEYEKAKGEKHE